MKTFLEYSSVKASDGAHIDEDGNLMDLTDDSVIEKLNAFVGSIGIKEYLSPEAAVNELRNKLMRVGINFGDVQFNQTIVRNEANFVSWTLQYIGENPDYTDGTLSYSVDASGNKLTVTYPAGGGYIYTKVNDNFPGTDCKN